MTPEKRHIKVLTARINYLTDKIANCSDKAKSHHIRERAAIIWSLQMAGVLCSDCEVRIGEDSGPADGWQLGRYVKPVVSLIPGK